MSIPARNETTADNDEPGFASVDVPRAPFTEGDTTWMSEALCVNVESELFFSEDRAGIRAAKSICAVCPVREECLRYALERPDLDGIWGGTTTSERRQLRRRARSNRKPGLACGEKVGSERGFRAHHRVGEPACPRCRDAHAAHIRRYRAEVTSR